MHLTGFVRSCDENEILIAHINPRGEYDGFILKHLDDLYRVDCDGEYEKKIQRLYQLKEQSHPHFDCTEEGALFPLLKFAKETESLITVELEGDKITGFVREYADLISLDAVNDFGARCGTVCVEADEIVSFSCDTDNEQDLKLLSD